MNAPGFGYLDLGNEEGLFLGSRLGHATHCGISHGPRISHHSGGGTVENLIIRKLLRYNFLPFPEADQHVLFHRQIAFDEVCHRWRFDPQQFVRGGVNQFLGGPNRRPVLTQKHGAINDKMMVVSAVEGINIHGARLGQELAIGSDSLLVVYHYVAILPAQYINMGGHVD